MAFKVLSLGVLKNCLPFLDVKPIQSCTTDLGGLCIKNPHWNRRLQFQSPHSYFFNESGKQKGDCVGMWNSCPSI